MPFEFAFLDWLQQFRTPVMDRIAIFFDYAGAHGELWIILALVLLAFPRTLRFEPCRHPAGAPSPRALLSLRAHSLRLCRCLCPLPAAAQAGNGSAGPCRLHRLYPAVPLRPLPHRHSGRGGAGACAGSCRLPPCRPAVESSQQKNERITKPGALRQKAVHPVLFAPKTKCRQCRGKEEKATLPAVWKPLNICGCQEGFGSLSAPRLLPRIGGGQFF